MTEKPLGEQSYLSFFQMKTSLILAYFLYAVTQVNESFFFWVRYNVNKNDYDLRCGSK